MKVFDIPFYVCGCGYETTHASNANKHKKTSCGQELHNEIRKMVLERDAKELIGNATPIGTQINGDTIHHTVVGTQNITINLTVPDKSVVSSVYDAVKNQDCVNELRGADPSEIPAILFKYTRGKMADQKYITYDPDKNVVKHVDPVTKREVSQDLKKYRNEYLVDSSDVFDDTYHLQYLPQRAQVPLKDLTKPAFDTGKKKDDPISGAEVVKMCAAGDHRMYKLPHDSKKFYTDVAKNVDIEIKSTV
jgi:hypothetical protein